MQLVEFQGQVGTKDAFSIRARDLDGNFRRLKPLTNGQYGINETQDGWSLSIFPAYPETISASAAYFLSYGENGLQWSESAIAPPPTGTPGWRLVERCDGKQMYVWGTEWADPVE